MSLRCDLVEEVLPVSVCRDEQAAVGGDDYLRPCHDHLEELVLVYDREERFGSREQVGVVVLCSEDMLQFEDIRSTALELRQCPCSDRAQYL